MNDAILNAHANKRRSRGDEVGADSEYTSIVAELRQLRAASQLSRYRGAAPRLPSREAISDIVGSLISALYPRHFGPPGLDARDADAFVARTPTAALPALKQQIELALALEQADARDAANANPRSTGDPIVEDDVVIFAGATILGRRTIGRGSSIGGNVWLTESVPPRSRITQAKTQANEGGHSI